MDVSELARILGRTDPVAAMGLEVVSRNPSVSQGVGRLLELRAGSKGINVVDPDPFLPYPTAQELAGDISIGRLVATGESFAVDSATLYNLLILGEIRTGKTNLLYVLLSHLCELEKHFVCCDLKRDYRHLERKFPAVEVIRAHEIKFNPLKPPPGVEPRKWLQIFGDAFCHSFGLLEGSGDFLANNVDEVYQAYGVYEGSDTYPTIRDLLTLIASKSHDRDHLYGPYRDFLQRVSERLSMLLVTLGDVLDVEQGFDLRKLTASQVVIELEYLAEHVQGYLVDEFLNWTYYYRMYNRDAVQLEDCYFIIDEARKIFSAKHDRGLIHSDMSILVSRSAEFRMFYLVADQMPTELSRAVIANTSTKVIFNLGSADDIRLVSQSCNLSREQTEGISQLQRGQAIVSRSGYLSPFVVDIPLVDVEKNVSDAEVESHSRSFLEMLRQDVRPAEHGIIEEYLKRKRENGINQRARDMARHVAAKPLMPMTDRYEDFGVSRATGDKIVDGLERRGWVKRVEIATGERGGKPKFLEFTNAGKKYVANELGIKTHHLNKGVEHLYWQNRIWRWLNRIEGTKATLEAVVGRARIDVLAQMQGKLFAFECAMSPEYESENIKRDLEAGCERVVVVLKNLIGASRIRRDVEALGLESRVMFVLATEMARKRQWILQELRRSYQSRPS